MISFFIKMCCRSDPEARGYVNCGTDDDISDVEETVEEYNLPESCTVDFSPLSSIWSKLSKNRQIEDALKITYRPREVKLPKTKHYSQDWHNQNEAINFGTVTTIFVQPVCVSRDEGEIDHYDKLPIPLVAPQS